MSLICTTLLLCRIARTEIRVVPRNKSVLNYFSPNYLVRGPVTFVSGLWHATADLVCGRVVYTLHN